MKNKIKPDWSHVRMIILIGSVCIFLFTYFSIYLDYITITEETMRETGQVDEQIGLRNQELIREEELRSELTRLEEQTSQIIKSFAPIITREDNLQFIADLKAAVKVEIPTISMSDNTIFYTTILPSRPTDIALDSIIASEDAENLDDHMVGLKNTITIQFKTSYEGFKDMVDYINSYPDKSTIEKVNISYDSSTFNLSGSMDINRYFLWGNGEAYEPPYIDDISIGTDNIFGLGSKAFDKAADGE